MWEDISDLNCALLENYEDQNFSVGQVKPEIAKTDENECERSFFDNTSSSSSDLDEESEEAFLFKSSLKVGSTFLEITTNCDDNSEVILNHTRALCHLKNITSDTVVAYYTSTKKRGFINSNCRLKNFAGLLLPGEEITIKVSKRDFQNLDLIANDPEDDIMMVKAMPVDELQINSSNVCSHRRNLANIFNKYNIDLMFTLLNIEISIKLQNLLDVPASNGTKYLKPPRQKLSRGKSVKDTMGSSQKSRRKPSLYTNDVTSVPSQSDQDSQSQSSSFAQFQQ
ncbi:unnamed protein product [Moneuplotes crassus]|uniref:Uncharacterized protein n=1 Tax=Euplotes crassus TaxID=5936 RepID=A0AAD1XMM4_EUPCR|nr:unnamed protein product [Moneuplotes crassus]